MGFFSWLTADTKESIRNIHAGDCRTVYLLQPGTKPNIEELMYGGYGIFGGVDAYEWLAEMNMDKDTLKQIKDTDKLREYGIELEFGRYYVDKNTGTKWAYRLCMGDVKPFGGSYIDIIDEYGKSPNDLIEEGIWEERPVGELLNDGREYYPLKFSFDKNAVYEDLPASGTDPAQGFFYESDEEAVC